MGMRARQGGWAGLIGLLIALVIVVLLGRALLRQMGLLTSAPKPAAAAAPGDVQTDVAAPTPTAALERARALQQQVQQQARENAERIDKAAQ